VLKFAKVVYICVYKRVVVHAKKNDMKRLTTFLISFLLYAYAFADIAPNPIVVKGIYTVDSCKIQMVSEFVYAELYNDSARVECTFILQNFGASTTIQVGFPEMNFQYWSIGQYSEEDKANFEIFVDDKRLTENDIKVPAALEEVYNKYMYVYHIEREYKRKTDSIYSANRVTVNRHGTRTYPSNQAIQETKDAMFNLFEWRESKPYFGSELWSEFNEQMKKGNFPWYVWDVHFAKDEKKAINVIYSLPSGMGYGANYRYFKYILETGAGWYGVIEKADIKLQLHDIKIENIEQISPIGFQFDKEQKTITWNFKNLEPTSEDDIYVRYYNTRERRNWERYQRKRNRAIFFRRLNPINWFRN